MYPKLSTRCIIKYSNSLFDVATFTCALVVEVVEVVELEEMVQSTTPYSSKKSNA